MAECPSFQTRVGAPDATEALKRIPVLISVTPPPFPVAGEPTIEYVPRPRAIVCEPERMVFGRSGYITNTDVIVVYEIDVPEEYKSNDSSVEGPAPDEMIIDIGNFAGLVTKEIMLIGESGLGHPFVYGGEKMQRATRSMTKEEGDYIRLVVRYNCGTRGASGGA